MTEFRGRAAANQVVTTALTQITFGTEKFDTDAGFASSRFTVPASWNGRYGEFFANLYVNADENGYISIQVSTNGGTIWSYVARTQYYQGVACCVASGPLLMTTGHIYRATIQNTSAATLLNDELTNFSGRLINLATVPTREYFRARASTTQAISNTTLTAVNFGTEISDTGSNFASNVYTVPADLNGGFGIFHCGILQNGTTEDVYSYIKQSTDGGSTYPTFMAAKINQLTKASSCTTGVVALTTGHKYRVEVYTNTGGFTVAADINSFFAGEMYKS